MIERETILSEDRVYRYILWRTNPPDDYYAMFIGLNPSTADETADDPTIRRCVGFTKAWGLDSLCMVNLFAYRSTDPNALKTAGEIVGPENDKWLWEAAQGAAVIVAAWGKPGKLAGRDSAVRHLLKDFSIKCLGKNGDGSPKHPLYLKASTELTDF